MTTLFGTLFGAIPAWLKDVPGPGKQMDSFFQDVRFACRSLAKSPAFTAVAVASLALGIGANTAIFSVVNTVLLRGLPYPGADRLVVIWESNDTVGVERTGPSGATFLDWRERAESFEEMVLFQAGSTTVTDLSEPEQVPAMRVTVNFFDLLGVDAAHGRGFLPAEGSGGRVASVVATDGFWQRAYGGNPKAIGDEFQGDHLPLTLVGVLPRHFWYPLKSDLFVPWDEDELRSQNRARREYGVLARLRPDVTLEQARAEMRALSKQLAAEHPEMQGWGTYMAMAEEEASGFLRPALLVLFGAVGFVLLIACANVANLMLARASDRQREIAVRAATGASRARLLRQLLTESLLLAAGGGIAGLALGYAGVEALRLIVPAEIPLPNGGTTVLVPQLTVAPIVMAFSAIAALATGLIFGLVPAWHTSLIELSDVLRGGDRGNTASKRASAARRILVAGEIAMSVVLVTGAFLMIETFWNLSQVDPGFRAANLLTLQLELPTDSRYETNSERADFYKLMMRELRAIPGVETAGLSEVLPLDNTMRMIEFRRLDDNLAAGDEGISVDYNLADAGYFQSLGVPLVRGRMFEAIDNQDVRAVALVDTEFADAFFPQGAVGERFTAWGGIFEIIGVVGAVRNAGLSERPRPMFYLHTGQSADDMMSVVLRSRGDIGALAQAAKEAVWRVDPEQPVFNVRRMEDVVAQGTSSHRLTLTLLGIFGLLAVFMAALGVYGVMSYSVGQRTRELGLRRALGAGSNQLLQMIVAEATRVAAAGVAIGVAAALVVGRVMSSMLYGVSSAQPLAFLLVAAVLMSVAALAALVPARRAAGVDPMIALRSG
ncbi:MAG: FtsX-like permease family protein [Acidobacteria bacterium]|nr:FtsX-like permease family protein [Acidobacteriota bacterium]